MKVIKYCLCILALSLKLFPKVYCFCNSRKSNVVLSGPLLSSSMIFVMHYLVLFCWMRQKMHIHVMRLDLFLISKAFRMHFLRIIVAFAFFQIQSCEYKHGIIKIFLKLKYFSGRNKIRNLFLSLICIIGNQLHTNSRL